MAQVSTKSTQNDTVLLITDIQVGRDGSIGDYRVEVKRMDLECAIRVCGFMSDGFGAFFESLDESMTREGGWPELKTWASLEGEFSLAASSDSLGHTNLIATLKSGPYDHDWSVEVGILLDASQLSELARSARRALEPAAA